MPNRNKRMETMFFENGPLERTTKDIENAGGMFEVGSSSRTAPCSRCAPDVPTQPADADPRVDVPTVPVDASTHGVNISTDPADMSTG